MGFRYPKTYMVIHHSATHDGDLLDWQSIRRYHVEHRGWDDVGYHLGIEFVNGHYEILAGRPLRAKAAAARQYNLNESGIHVCFVGNYDEGAPSETMLQYAAPRLVHVCELAGIPVDDRYVIGHRDVVGTACPGKEFAIGRLISLMRQS